LLRVPIDLIVFVEQQLASLNASVATHTVFGVGTEIDYLSAALLDGRFDGQISRGVKIYKRFMDILS
jgi:hypothetical protein